MSLGKPGQWLGKSTVIGGEPVKEDVQRNIATAADLEYEEIQTALKEKDKLQSCMRVGYPARFDELAEKPPVCNIPDDSPPMDFNVLQMILQTPQESTQTPIANTTTETSHKRAAPEPVTTSMSNKKVKLEPRITRSRSRTKAAQAAQCKTRGLYKCVKCGSTTWGHKCARRK